MRHVLGAHVARHESDLPVVLLIVQSLSRRATRFAALMAKFRAGTLRAPRPAPSASPLAHARPDRPALAARVPDPLPRGPGWLVRMVQPVAIYASLFEHMLTEPEMVALLAVSPQAGRLLRPLWRMLSADPLPEILRASPPEARPRRIGRARRDTRDGRMRPRPASESDSARSLRVNALEFGSATLSRA